MLHVAFVVAVVLQSTATLTPGAKSTTTFTSCCPPHLLVWCMVLKECYWHPGAGGGGGGGGRWVLQVALNVLRQSRGPGCLKLPTIR